MAMVRRENLRQGFDGVSPHETAGAAPLIQGTKGTATMAKVIDIKSRVASCEGRTPGEVRAFLVAASSRDMSRSRIARDIVAREPWVVPSIGAIERVLCEATLATHRTNAANPLTEDAWEAAYDLRELASEVYCYACDKRDGFRHE